MKIIDFIKSILLIKNINKLINAYPLFKNNYFLLKKNK